MYIHEERNFDEENSCEHFHAPKNTVHVKMASRPPIPASSARNSQSEASDAILTLLSTVIAKIISKGKRMDEVDSSDNEILALSTAIAKNIKRRETMYVEEVILVLAEKHGKHKYELDEESGMAAKLLSEYVLHLIRGINAYEKASNLDDALTSFTASIAHAECRTLLLVTCQIRAFVLQKMRNYDAAVADLDRALLSNPSPEMKQDLEDQEAQCLQAKTEVIATISTVQRSGPQSSSLPGQTDLESFTGSVDGTAEVQWSNLLELASPHTPNPFPSIKYACDAKRGQYLEAAEDIEPGQVIISDKFWTVKLEDELKYEYCSYCFKRCVTLIPCPSCSREMYCGERCRKEANDSYHRLECKITSKTSSWGTLETMLTRMILVSTGQGRRLNDLMTTVKALEIFSPGYLASEKMREVYPRVLRLRTKYPYDWEIIDEYVSTAARIIVWLERVGFFDVNSSLQSSPAYPAQYHQLTLTEAQVFTGMLLLNYATALKTHSLEFVSYGSRLTMVQNRVMGVGVTALPSVLRHSCLPNAHIFNRHRNLVIVAGRRIKKGEEIFVSYIKNAHYPDSPVRERLALVFNHYGYACKCEACANKWSTFEQLEKSSRRFLNNIKVKSTRNRVRRAMIRMKKSPQKPDSKVSTPTATTSEEADLSKRVPVSKVTTPEKVPASTVTTPEKVGPSKGAPTSKVIILKKVFASTTTTHEKIDTSKTSPEKVSTSGATAAGESASPKKPVSPLKKATPGGGDSVKGFVKLGITTTQTSDSSTGPSGARATEKSDASQEASIAEPPMAPPPSPTTRNASVRARICRTQSPQKPDTAATTAVEEGISQISPEDVSKEASPMQTARPPGFDSSAESSTEPEGRRKKAATLPSERRITGQRKIGAAESETDAGTGASQEGDAPKGVRGLTPTGTGEDKSSAAAAAAPPPIRETASGEADTSKAAPPMGDIAPEVANMSQAPSAASRVTAPGNDQAEFPNVRTTTCGKVEKPRAPTSTTTMSAGRTKEKKEIWKPIVPGVPFITLRPTYGLVSRDSSEIKYELRLADEPEAPVPEEGEAPKRATSHPYLAAQRLFRSQNLKVLDRRQTLTLHVLDRYNEWQKEEAQEPMNTIAKSDEYADLIFAVGQTKYSDEEFLEAVNYFTVCLAYAPNKSSFMMTALLQRARALYHQRMYDDALATIQYALDTGNYLDQGRGELDELKRMCEDGKRAPPPKSPKKKETREEARARKAKAAKEANAARAKKPTRGGKVGKGAAKPAKGSQMPKKEEERKPWKEPNFQNPNIPNATSKVRFVYDQHYGRGLEATEDIEPGEPIIFHSYTFTALDEDKAYLCCAYCLKRSYSMIPCPGCVENMYCSAACLQKAYDEYHRLECKIWTPFRTNAEFRPMSHEVMMLIRMMLVNSKQGSEWTKIVNRFAQPKDVFSPATLDEVGDAPIDDYKSLLRWRRVNDWISMARDARIASRVVHMLKFAGFFQDKSPNTVSLIPDSKMTVAELMAALIFLNHSVTMNRQKFCARTFEITPAKISESIIGTVVSPLATVIPHACFHNLYFTMSDRDFVAFAVQPIKRGERLTLGYMSELPTKPKAERRKYLLQSFGIICQCTACTIDMPLKCVNEIKMPEYLNSETMKKARTALIGIGRPAADEVYFNKMSYKKMMRMVNEVFEWMEEHLNPPHYYETYSLMQVVRTLWSIQYDDYHKDVADKDRAKEIVRSGILRVMSRADIDVKSLPGMV